MFDSRQYILKQLCSCLNAVEKESECIFVIYNTNKTPRLESSRTPLWEPTLSSPAILSPSLAAFILHSVNGYFLKEAEQPCEGESLHGQCWVNVAS